MTTRRGFLGMLAAAPVAAAKLPAIVEELAAPPTVARYVHQTVAIGFAIAADVAGEAFYGHGLMSADAFRAAMATSLNAVFSEAYAQNEEDWQELYDHEEHDEDCECDDCCPPILYGFGAPR